MRKLFVLLFCILLTLSPITAFAQTENVDESTPRLMVTEYKVEDGFVKPDSIGKLTIKIKNTNPGKDVSNIKLSISDESGDIKIDGMGTKYVKSIKANGEYTWTVNLITANTATATEHKLNLNMEYEDANYRSFSANDTLLVQVRQTASLDYSGLTLPAKVVQGSTNTLTINLMNTGKGMLYNCKLDFDIDGLDSGGSVFVGNIEPAQSSSGTANLKADTETLGEVKGIVKIVYEDDYGKKYEKTVEVSTVIEEKIEVVEQPEEKEKKDSLWWVFLIIGLVAGGGAGFGIPWLIKDKKQRKEDDLRL